jgi:hypothetical protein
MHGELRPRFFRIRTHRAERAQIMSLIQRRRRDSLVPGAYLIGFALGTAQTRKLKNML